MLSTMSSLADGLDVIGDRWSLLVVQALGAGPQRFGELQAQVSGIATNVLVQRLRQLEQRGLVAATPYSTRPPRFQYSLTDDGRRLGPVLAALTEWAAHRANGELAVHEACGTPIEMRPWCPTCEQVVDADAHELHHL